MQPSKTELKNESSNDTSAYDLIMKDKEKLLSFDEPTRFIFSHSALKEGWDNPNVFQICTLKDSDNQTKKRQEVGRGMRLCVNSQGERQDETVLHGRVFEVNELTVIASESYDDFAKKLQKKLPMLLATVLLRYSLLYLWIWLSPMQMESRKDWMNWKQVSCFQHWLLMAMLTGKDNSPNSSTTTSSRERLISVRITTNIRQTS